ncbi:hypothetical protein EDB19DRAFT_1724224 [Suillus lakei]|nr:hypothetical protein EDB19DRAFT_1724224 [Suillus lakei]
MLIRPCPWRSVQLHQLWLPRQIHTRETIHDKRWPGWQVVVGIEVHAQIKSRRKLFSGASLPSNRSQSFTSCPGEIPNTTVSAFDSAFPGTLPVRPTSPVLPACNLTSRNTIFTSDLPAGYQITQRYSPLASGGYIKLSKGDVAVGITQIQLEQDTAKSTFDGLRQSPEEAADYVRTLQAVLRCVGSSDGNMEQGSFRCDVNVSVNKHGQPYGTRCEIKNLNSVKFMMMAITSEVFRHIELLESGHSVPQDTRGFDENKAETFKLRSKADSPDYRYMPDPNIPPLLISEEYIETIRKTMPDLPDATRARLLNLGLSGRDTDVLMAVDSGREVGFDGELGKGARDPRVVVNWMRHELLGQLTARKETFSDNPVSVEQLGELIDLVQDGKITGTSGKSLLKHIIANRSLSAPSVLAQEFSLEAVSEDDNAITRSWCVEAIEALPEEAEAVRQGNPRVLNKLVGKVMQLSRGRADARNARVVLEDVLRR